MSITTALEARRDALREREAGFTLIELLVVVIIIGILAAIAIPVYLGVQNNAKDSAVKSDLTNAKTAIVAAATDNQGAIPSAITDAGSATVNGTTGIDLTKSGWSKSSNTSSLKYVVDSTSAPTKWCIIGTSSTNNTFIVQMNQSGVTNGTTNQATCVPA